MPNTPKSPLTGSAAVRLRSVDIDGLKAAYRSAHGIDVGPFLPAIDAFEVYRCPDTALEFFWPLDVAGPPEFYAALYQDTDWGYQDEKWEFAVAASLIDGAANVLDVGAGGGAFLHAIEGKVTERTGLETNPNGRGAAVRLGLTLHDETVQAHAASYPGQYEAVTAFQVLEHVPDPAAFIAACIDLLKPGGKLILSTPNNDSFLHFCNLLPLNCPPHHLTLWGRETFHSLERLYPVELTAIETEPLQENNLGWYRSMIEERYLPHNRFLRSAYYRLGFASMVDQFIKEQRTTILGHTILAAFRRRD